MRDSNFRICSRKKREEHQLSWKRFDCEVILDDETWPGHDFPSCRKKSYGVNLVRLIRMWKFSNTDLTATNLIFGQVAFIYIRAEWRVLPYLYFLLEGILWFC